MYLLETKPDNGDASKRRSFEEFEAFSVRVSDESSDTTRQDSYSSRGTLMNERVCTRCTTVPAASGVLGGPSVCARLFRDAKSIPRRKNSERSDRFFSRSFTEGPLPRTVPVDTRGSHLSVAVGAQTPSTFRAVRTTRCETKLFVWSETCRLSCHTRTIFDTAPVIACIFVAARM